MIPAPQQTFHITAQRWNAASDDLALPLPTEIQERLELSEHSTLQATFAEGLLVLTNTRGSVRLTIGTQGETGSNK